MKITRAEEEKKFEVKKVKETNIHMIKLEEGERKKETENLFEEIIIK